MSSEGNTCSATAGKPEGLFSPARKQKVIMSLLNVLEENGKRVKSRFVSTPMEKKRNHRNVSYYTVSSRK